MKKPLISLVVPVFNEEDTIPLFMMLYDSIKNFKI